MVEIAILPTDEQMRTLGAQLESGGRVTMLNLLRYRKAADYSGFPDEKAFTGREAYRRYMEVVRPCLEAIKARIVFSGPVAATVIGPANEIWDDMILVEYPTPQSLGEMRASAEYQAIEHHRTAALENSRLYAIGIGEIAADS